MPSPAAAQTVAVAPPADAAAVPDPEAAAAVDRERFLRSLAAAMFLLFFQTYMVAPLIPSLADAFGVARQTVGLLVPAYTVPYAVGGLVLGALADRLG
ncbi:MAG: transporter, partial [Phycisphaerales bacterium]|nr:transporter [Phycisphaerales bacterium]